MTYSDFAIRLAHQDRHTVFQKYPIVFITILYATVAIAFAIIGDINVAIKGDGFETLSSNGIVWFPIIMFSVPFYPILGIVSGITQARPEVLILGIIQFTILFTLLLAGYILTRTSSTTIKKNT